MRTQYMIRRSLVCLGGLCILLVMITSFIAPNKPTANAQAGANFYNATEHNVGNYYGSRATIERTDPILRSGHWVYHRTMALHNNAPNACFKFSEIGWWKKTTVNFEGYLAYKNGCGNSGYGWLSFSISPGTHTYSQQYLESWGLPDRYGFHVDGAWLGSGVTNFSYTTSVGCGGEVWGGMEAMGNTYCSSNLKGMKSAPNVYYFTPWGSHTNYVDNAPYTNVNDPNNVNGFWSTGNEVTPTPIP